jgi:hypothetical protein
MKSLKGEFKAENRMDLVQEYRLHQIHSGDYCVRRVRLYPEPEEGLIIHDVRVGRNSQTACSGRFKAEILNRLPDMRFDPISNGMDITVIFEGGYEGRCEVELVRLDKIPRTFIYPMGRTQIEGKVKEIVATKQLFEAVESGKLKLTIRQSIAVPQGQESPVTASASVTIRDGRLMLSKTLDVSTSDQISQTFEGEMKDHFSSLDLVAILQMNDR